MRKTEQKINKSKSNMGYVKLPHVNNQHTVPRGYLTNFSDNGTHIFRKFKRVYTDDKTLKYELNAPASLKKATVNNGFYSVKSGKEPMLVETLVYHREIENHYQKIYDLLINPQVKGFNMEERTRILMCLLSLHCRTPKQFHIFFEYVKDMVPDSEEMNKVKEDYKGVHVKDVLTSFISAHEFKIVRIVKITDTSEFITSDNPVLIVDDNGDLRNHEYRQQFNIDNKILIPLDKKHCCILTSATDVNGIDIRNKVFYNKIERIEVDCSFTQNINRLMLGSADKYYYGSEKYMKAFFSLWKLVK